MTSRRCLVSALLVAASTASAFAQFGAPAAPAAPATPASSAVAENLNLRFANGIVAVAEEKIITVADIMQYIGPLLPQLRQEARSEKEFQERLEQLQDSAIQDLVDRVLIVKEFRKDEKRQIPHHYVDNAIADEIAERFEGDRSKYLAYLKAKGQTQRDYRREKEEDIIFSYMQGQQRKSQSIVSPVRILLRPSALKAMRKVMAGDIVRPFATGRDCRRRRGCHCCRRPGIRRVAGRGPGRRRSRRDGFQHQA
jgi:peptidyl-prolyl cis-trans isomerase SurA